MILITVTINEEYPEGPIDVRYTGQDINGFTDAEGDLADQLKDALVKRRDEIFVEKGWTKVPIVDRYRRAFRDPKKRDNHTGE